MPENNHSSTLFKWLRTKIPTFFARSLGVDGRRKAALYLDLSRAATLKDLVYWLQIVFAAGIATLGLVLNSPAVIIGAMLISPLMNPILASGLALATGDLVLGLRAVVNLILSCAAAIVFAMLLVVALPFREMTAEIAARTQPNVLDLLIALFSGAVGSVAICREVRGVVTSIPGVAIAVALMPPLCVVGYGIGLMIIIEPATGWRVASGGGLLFLTNLIAITLTAMLVFLALRIDSPKVREQVAAWEQQDTESRFVIESLQHFPGLEKARIVHSFPLRAAMILLPLVLILIPLSSAFSQLKNEIARKQRESEIRQVVTEVWQEKFQKNTSGAARSTIDHLAVTEINGKLDVSLRVFDDEPYSLAEKKQCTRLLAERLNRPVEAINLKLTEIPTVSILETVERSREETPPPKPTATELRENLLDRLEIALSDFNLPPPAQILRKPIAVNANQPVEVKIVYLGDAPIAPEIENLIVEKAKQSLNDAQAVVNFERIPVNAGNIVFDRRSAVLPILGMLQLDFAGRMLRENANLTTTVAIQSPARGETPELTTERMRAVTDYLVSRWQITPGKIKQVDASDDDSSSNLSGSQSKTLLVLQIGDPPEARAATRATD